MTHGKIRLGSWPAEQGRSRLQLAGPLYLQIRDDLRERIIDLQWSPGAMLPNESELAREFAVSVGTIRKALETLEDERMIVRKQGRGTFVSEMAGNNMAVRFGRYYQGDKPLSNFIAETIESRTGHPTPAEAMRLRVPPNASVARLTRRASAPGRCTIHEVITVPTTLFPDIDRQPSLPGDLYGFYRKTYDILIARVVERLRPAVANELAGTLGVAAGAPIIAVEREAYDGHGRAVELRRQTVHLEECDYRVDME